MNDVERIPVHRFTDGTFHLDAESVASECLVHVHINDEHLTSLLASPQHLDDLITGHLQTEYDVPKPRDGHDVVVSTEGDDIHLHIDIVNAPKLTSRNTVVTTACGGCEQDMLSDLVSSTPVVSGNVSEIPIERLIDALERMRSDQPGFSLTGGMHAAGLLYPTTETLVVREDIGRHNAVDKVIGAHCRSGTTTRPQALLLSGRCGWDIVSKAATMDIPIVASIGAASSLAAKSARTSNMTLVSFAKGRKAVVIGPVEGRIQRNH